MCNVFIAAKYILTKILLIFPAIVREFSFSTFVTDRGWNQNQNRYGTNVAREVGREWSMTINLSTRVPVYYIHYTWQRLGYWSTRIRGIRIDLTLSSQIVEPESKSFGYETLSQQSASSICPRVFDRSELEQLMRVKLIVTIENSSVSGRSNFRRAKKGGGQGHSRIGARGIREKRERERERSRVDREA